MNLSFFEMVINNHKSTTIDNFDMYGLCPMGPLSLYAIFCWYSCIPISSDDSMVTIGLLDLEVAPRSTSNCRWTPTINPIVLGIVNQFSHHKLPLNPHVQWGPPHFLFNNTSRREMQGLWQDQCARICRIAGNVLPGSGKDAQHMVYIKALMGIYPAVNNHWNLWEIMGIEREFPWNGSQTGWTISRRRGFTACLFRRTVTWRPPAAL